MKPGKVRIIAGRLRGSRLEVSTRDGLRPSSDRVRETVFNWLQQRIAGRRCLDLFAGSGALGFEAVSRGAREVVMVERDRELCAGLRASAERLKTPEVRVECADALDWLSHGVPARFDLVFVDPPFAAGLHAATLQLLHSRAWLAADALVYVEAAVQQNVIVPNSWQLLRDGQTREVRFALYRAVSPPPPDTLPASVPEPETAPA